MTEADQIKIQHILISFDATPVQAQRSKEDAEKLANEIFASAQSSDDFSAMVVEHSDDPITPGDTSPGTYNLANHNQEGEDFGAFISELNAEAEAKDKELRAKIEEGELSVEAATKTMDDFIEELRARSEAKQASVVHPRAAMVPAFGDVGFGLEIGAVGMAEFDTEKSPFGWHIIKRLA
jgi:hypothetical protein